MEYEKERSCGKFMESSKAYFAMISLQFGYAGMNIITKVSLNKGMSHYVLVAYRQAFATAAIAPFAFFLERYIINSLSISLCIYIVPSSIRLYIYITSYIYSSLSI